MNLRYAVEDYDGLKLPNCYSQGRLNNILLCWQWMMSMDPSVSLGLWKNAVCRISNETISYLHVVRAMLHNSCSKPVAPIAEQLITA